MATIRCLGHTFEQIEAVLFDKDGTLANVESYLIRLGETRASFVEDQVPGIKTALLNAFGIREGLIDPAGLIAVGSRYEDEIAAAAYVAATGRGWIEAIATVRAAFDQAQVALSPQVAQTPLLEGAAQLLAQLKAAGLKLGIVSSDSHSAVADFVQHYHMSEISWYCGAAPTTLPKTHPDFLKFACEAMAVHPSATLIIGDSAADLALSSQAAGFIGMTGGWRHPIQIQGATVNIRKLTQVESFS
jgi:phosphoglycolate phosphatase